MKMRFLRCIINANQHFVFLQTESGHFGQRDELVGRLAPDTINDPISHQNIFGSHLARLDFTGARHRGHEPVQRPRQSVMRIRMMVPCW